MVFTALAADTRPHFATIAEIISSRGDKITIVFRDILSICYAEGLIGKHMFAVDGCKIASNCAKEWRRIRKEDRGKQDPDQGEKEQRAVNNLKKKAKKIRE